MSAEDVVTVSLSRADLELVTEAVSELIYELTHYMVPPSRHGAEKHRDVDPRVSDLRRIYDVLNGPGGTGPYAD